MNLSQRPRRNRKCASTRDLVRETHLSPENLIYPVFVQEGDQNEDIASLPGCKRWSLLGLLEEARSAHALGIRALALFPAVSEEKKTPRAEESYNPEGLIPRAIRLLKKELPSLLLIGDIALDPYNSDGHDGLVEWQDNGLPHIPNDPSVSLLCQQALCQARSGVDIVAPSDMMDGRVGAIRATLDAAGFSSVSIMAYSAKYASSFYGPFRGALDSSPKAGDKKTYQMDPANKREAVREALLDEEEGADILMIKPALAYLDIIHLLRENTTLPLAAYQVSGEYLMLKAGAASGWIEEKPAVLESLLSIKRAGAQMILTYYAKDVASWLQDKN